jgi:galactokinase
VASNPGGVVSDQIAQQLVAAGMSSPQAMAKRQLFKSAIARLKSRGNDRQLHACYVPGRIEFLGKHTDYAGGRSLICAVDRGFCIVAAARLDQTVRVLGETEPSELVFPLERDLIPTEGHWSNYPMTVARRVARNFEGPLVGADIAFTSDLPASSGLSSSSAMIIAFFMALSSVNGLSHRPEYQSNIRSTLDLSAYLATIENGQTFGTLTGDRGVGTFGGSEDHTAILTGLPGQLSQYSFCPVRLERRVPLPAGYTLVIAVSGVIAEKTGAAKDAYNNASLSARAVLEGWRKATCRDDATLAAAVAEDGAVQRMRRCLADQKLVDRLDHFIAESTQIIPAAGDALIHGCLDQLGRQVDRSQELAEGWLRNQVPETVYLAKSARETGAVAASSFGAGFGGAVWALVQTSGVEQFIADWRSKYAAFFPCTAQSALFLPAAAGVAMMEIRV